MVQIPLRRAHRLRAITLASPIKKLRPQPTERAPTAWHTNDEYKNAEASEEASASSAVANASETRILPIPTPRHWLHQSCSYKRVSSVGRFYDGLRAARWRAERFLGLLAARGSGCALKTSRVSCLLITLSSSSAPTSLSRSITPISGRICSWHRVARPACMNAPISLKPFESEMKSSIWAIDNALPWEPRGADAFGAFSKKNATVTCRM